MNTKAAVEHAERVAHIWVHVGIMCLSVTITLIVYVLWLHTQLHNCYAGSLH